MAFQNRIALDMLLAEKGGVCGMFGEQCCTFIPNNTAPDGQLTKAIKRLRTLNKKMKEHSGVDTSMWDGWLDQFGRFKGLAASVLMSVALFAALLTLCGCCCIPCICALIIRLINTAQGKVGEQTHERMNLLDGNDGDDDSYGLPDLFPDPDDYKPEEEEITK